ncbi:hypothetical protein TWF696_001252 [Orbilia brochopaga]|uniref:Uncharacterized protein n=1 Tax=Orbilia brochopaga TaxID=3140254 RepID=A0AAV9U9T4_9PEZI
MATSSSPSPRPVVYASPVASPAPSPSSHHSTSSSTPPPRPPSSPGISVFAPRPMRVPMYRPQFSRPVFLYDSSEPTTTTPQSDNKENPAAPATRRSSVASTGIPEEEAIDKIIYSPTKDVLEELFKIVRPTSAAASTSSRPQPLHPRSPNAAGGHRRNTSDASDGGLSSILGGLSVLSSGGNPRASPDTSDWRTIRMAASPVARRALGNPMVRDPSFHGESKA